MIGVFSHESAMAAAQHLRVFAQPQRLLILATLIDRELPVGSIETETGIVQPALSQQLAELRRANLVTHRRQAKRVLYKLADDRTAAIVSYMVAVFGQGTDANSCHPCAANRREPPASGRASSAVFAVIRRN